MMLTIKITGYGDVTTCHHFPEDSNLHFLVPLLAHSNGHSGTCLGFSSNISVFSG
jgi:hypothetical protein